jgi:hypothetical protein|mmetsp:Transcript_40937/g.68733  ORF Transcript_40937/g.68733 Transcript_40937/m.68733 type:complete len:154 (-) Transcript_40937:560-1021(-)
MSWVRPCADHKSITSQMCCPPVDNHKHRRFVFEVRTTDLKLLSENSALLLTIRLPPLAPQSPLKIKGCTAPLPFQAERPRCPRLCSGNDRRINELMMELKAGPLTQSGTSSHEQNQQTPGDCWKSSFQTNGFVGTRAAAHVDDPTMTLHWRCV